MIWFVIIIFTLYAILIVSLAIGFTKIDEFKPENIDFKTTFSVIIPFRNEAENLPKLLKSISEIEYSKEFVEFIFVDDASDDSSVSIIQQVLDKISQESEITRTDIQLIQNERKSNSPKKDAIATAISIVKNEWIITTDADCVLPKNWLLTFNAFIQKNNPKMIVAPVNYIANNSFLEQFQLLDFMSLQGTTIGGFGIDFPFLCNGANLAYKKEGFLKQNGFDGNNDIASGDDIFLFEKFLNTDRKSVQFLKSKDAIVTTFPVKNWIDLIHQRVRWAAKTSSFKSTKVKLIGLVVLLINLSILLSLLGFVIQFISYNLLLILLSSKLIIDLFLFYPTVRFFNHRKAFLKWYFLASLLYPFFCIYVIFKSIFSKYNWKGRRFKK